MKAVGFLSTCGLKEGCFPCQKLESGMQSVVMCAQEGLDGLTFLFSLPFTVNQLEEKSSS